MLSKHIFGSNPYYIPALLRCSWFNGISSVPLVVSSASSFSLWTLSACLTVASPVCLSSLSHCSRRIQKSCLHISDPKWRVLQVTTWNWFLLHFSNLEQSGVQMQQLSHHLQGFIKFNILSGFFHVLPHTASSRNLSNNNYCQGQKSQKVT